MPFLVSLPLDDRPRQPPPPATPLTFPRYEPKRPPSGRDEAEYDLVKLFKPIRAITQLNSIHVSALNLRVNRDVPFDELFPTEHSPPAEWEPDSYEDNGASRPILSSGKPGPGYQGYHGLLKELLFDTESAYSSMERHDPDPNRNIVRPTHFRRFYQELRIVAEYWDTCLNDNSPVPRTVSALPTAPASTNGASGSDATSLPSTDVGYKGRRMSTGFEMPAMLRSKVLCEFLEPIIWAFGCRYDPPRSQPSLPLRNLRIPVNYAALVYRTPKERPKSSIGTLEGPVMGMQARSQTAFGGEDEQSDIVDLLREVGALLLLAQHRAREGTEEDIANADKWFVTKPRWGGGTGEAIGQPLGSGSIEEKIDDEDRSEAAIKESGEPPMKKRTHERSARAMKVKEVRKREDIRKSTLPPISKWDKRVKYMPVGKGKDQESDDIYMVSSVNHHISIVRLRVHPKYLRYLAEGGNPAGQTWFVLQMHRSRWFDLFNPEDRKAALDGVWGVLSWLLREL